MNGHGTCFRRSASKESEGRTEQRIVNEIWQLTQAGDSWSAFDLARTYVMNGGDGYALAEALLKRGRFKKQLAGVS